MTKLDIFISDIIDKKKDTEAQVLDFWKANFI